MYVCNKDTPVKTLVDSGAPMPTIRCDNLPDTELKYVGFIYVQGIFDLVIQLKSISHR